MTDPRRSVTRRLRRTLGNAFALAYLALCTALFVWAVAVSVADDSGESMALIFPLLATAPTSFVLFLLPGGLVTVVAVVVLGALVNAAVIGWCAGVLRRGARSDPAS
ncbi:SCO4225 family membrane protein [Streptomyces sp. NPDC057052]|uniref:SCO4225 family membrane protein n=1 Tax=Streptomyces sp. NPDC057052 TaxID=3346010 RepID=UPI00363E85CC